MTNVFLAIMFACMFVQYFYINFNVQILNSAADNLPLALIEEYVNLMGDSPVFIKDQLDKAIVDYFDKALPNISHKAWCEFYAIDGDISLPEGDFNGVNVYLSSDFSMMYSYQKCMYYEIIGGMV